ncbi:hypothetical protein MM239_19880 [Belliella sp. DSM 111904]|uniref:Uncharacterized protein n=1 Tax=Belliella filtrata TaxID=2923435 RepID=A0ABS9V5F7_9BACT|nr:DUF6629 family protein [Belliella filtrata]MCH7411656.1 hypothetical protein [Belliella filtrata]
MCFSTSVSIGAGVVLTIVGVASIKKTHHNSQLLFSSIPLLFGVQQMAEGILWLTLPNLGYEITQKIFTYIFLFFAQFLWPVWVPISILLLEKKGTRKNIQKVLVGAGILVGIYLLYCLFTFHVEAKIVGHHIVYIQDYPSSLRIYGMLLYGLATILPPFFSHIKRMKLFGIAVIVSYAVSAIFYEHYILSVWCFFAAIVSLSIYAIMTNISKEKPRN